MARGLQLLLVAALALVVGAVGTRTDVLQRAELATVDARFDVRGEQDPPRDVVVVGIDAYSLGKLGVRPPLPRDLQATVVDRLRRAGARVIAYDLEVLGESADVEADNAIFRAIRRAPGTVLAATQFDDGVALTFGGRPETHRALRAVIGSTNFPADAAVGGVIRRIPRAEDGVPSFAVAAATRFRGSPPDVERFAGDGAWLDVPGPAGTIPHLRYADVALGTADLDGVRGKVAVVGSIAPGLQDISPTAAGSGVPGPEIQAAAIDTILRDFPLRDPPGLVVALLVAAAALLTPLSALRLRGLGWLPVPAASLLVLPVGAQLGFASGTVLPVAGPAAALLVALTGTTVVAYATDLRDRRRLRAQFGRFVGPQVVDAMVDAAGGEARLGGRRVEATVLFCDLRGFTTLAERLDPPAVIDLLNLYLAQMSDAILDRGGTVVTYLGDGIMAVFGAPVECDDHADRALAAAADMLGPRLQAFSAAARSDLGVRDELAIGVGVCTGPVMSGTVGSSRRLEYTAVGDTTNTAARLQAACRELGVTSVVAASTRDALTRPVPALSDLGPVAVRGRTEPVRAFTLG